MSAPAAPPVVTRRRGALASLREGVFDLLVIGGGINGAGIARDAAMRGLRTVVVEQGDLASGTSSRSSKLIHGGLRYLEQGHVRLVLEAVRERERLRRLAPHLVEPQAFLFPIYRGGPMGLAKLAAGLWAYDLLAGWWTVRRHRMLGRRAVAAAEPRLRQNGLRGGGLYFDYRTDDARLVLETALAAHREGAVVLSYVAVAGFVKADGRIVGARLHDRLGGEQIEVRARAVVNATGPWVDAVAALDRPAAPRLRLTKGVHVVLPRARIGNNAALVLRAVRDGRAMFVIPWDAQVLVGTTDTDHAGGPDAAPVVEADDVAYLLETVNHYFPEARLVPSDVVSAFAGLRPLVAPAPGEDLDPSSVSREEEVFVSPAGLISLAGGKLTTYRLIAQGIVDRVIETLRRDGDTRRFGPCRTGAVRLPGGEGEPEVLAATALSRDGHGLAPAVVSHLAHRYGSRLAEVLGLVARDRALATPIAPGLPDPQAEVVAAVEQEWALTLEDVLRRRTRVALRDANGGVTSAEAVAGLMAGSLGWDPETAHAAARAFARDVEDGRRRWR